MYTDVAAGILIRPDGRVLLGKRAEGTPFPGYWEFPGGKLEAGETPAQALHRELREELGITPTILWPWLTRIHRYPHAQVRIFFFRIPAWSGHLSPQVHAALSWEDAMHTTLTPMLPANAPVLKALTLPVRMGISAAAQLGIAEQLRRMALALAHGLPWVQLRETILPFAVRRDFYAQALSLCIAHNALCVINGDIALAQALRSEQPNARIGLHLPEAQLLALSARPDFAWVGASCHDRAGLECAARWALDYALLGAVKHTLSHPGRQPLGWPCFAAWVRDLPMPVLAIGGLTDGDQEDARAAGAHGIALLSRAWC